MSEFRITQVGDREDWGDGGEYGPKSTFKIAVEGDQGRTQDGAFAELVQKRETAAPTVGQTLNGSLVTERGRLRFKKDKPANGAGGGFKGGGGKSPAEKAEIRRMHSQEMCIRWLALLHARGKVPEDASLAWVREQIDWWEEDAQKAGAAA